MRHVVPQQRERGLDLRLELIRIGVRQDEHAVDPLRVRLLPELRCVPEVLGGVGAHPGREARCGDGVGKFVEESGGIEADRLVAAGAEDQVSEQAARFTALLEPGRLGQLVLRRGDVVPCQRREQRLPRGEAGALLEGEQDVGRVQPAVVAQDVALQCLQPDEDGWIRFVDRPRVEEIDHHTSARTPGRPATLWDWTDAARFFSPSKRHPGPMSLPGTGTTLHISRGN